MSVEKGRWNSRDGFELQWVKHLDWTAVVNLERNDRILEIQKMKLTNLEDFSDMDVETGGVKAYFHVSGLHNWKDEDAIHWDGGGGPWCVGYFRPVPPKVSFETWR